MLFEDQAERFDERAGLPAGVAEKAAAAVAALAGLGSADGLLEIGVGTGEIGLHLAALPLRYAGLDLSHAMLRVFRARSARKARLFQADGDRGWPVRPGSVAAVFGSRSLHFIRPPHLADELARATGGRQAVLILGSVKREEGSVKEAMRHRMRKLLKEAGFQGRGGRRWREALWLELAGRGGARLETRTVAAWRTASSPRQSLEGWSGKAGLAGLAIPEDVKQSVLERLRQWAGERYGSLDESLPGEESYVLEGMAFRP
ncbi:MAG TPA: class I SAM-dependent methyltransferase [Fibrobacteria bacterium]|nr:class I SAM-dependent methyltransferase [Fibrobacteria bacterium]